MSHALTTVGNLTKNLIATPKAWLILVEIDASGIGGGTYRYSSDMSASAWYGIIYSPMAMEFEEVAESLKGDLPRVTMRLPGVSSAIRTAVNSHDGLRGAQVTVNVIDSSNLASATADITEVFEILETTLTDIWVTFTLGFADPLGRRFPRDRYTASSCRHLYKPLGGAGAFCKYIGSEPSGEDTCNHTLAACEDRNNQDRFGGSPGVDEGIYQ